MSEMNFKAYIEPLEKNLIISDIWINLHKLVNVSQVNDIT